MYVCICNGITDRDVREAVHAGASDLSQLSAMTGCSTVCGSCGDLALEIMEETRREHFSLPLLAACGPYPPVRIASHLPIAGG